MEGDAPSGFSERRGEDERNDWFDPRRQKERKQIGFAGGADGELIRAYGRIRLTARSTASVEIGSEENYFSGKKLVDSVSLQNEAEP